MSTLTITEKSKLEKLLRMGSGYVLDFSNNSLQNFVADSVKLDINDEKYNQGSGYKAHRLRALWSHEPDEVVGRLLSDLLDKIPEDWERRREITGDEIPEDIQRAYEESKRACERLLGKMEVEHLDDLKAIDYDENFQLLSKQIKASIDSGEPATGLDRLHTFLIKYLRHLCAKRGLTTTKEEPLNAVFGKYVKALVASGVLKSVMSQNILKFSTNILSSFNAVRNDQSLAHDNAVLNREESLLIFRNISALVKFIEHLEEGS
jgi:hypothetical protein